jgi:hypothetical protein
MNDNVNFGSDIAINPSAVQKVKEVTATYATKIVSVVDESVKSRSEAKTGLKVRKIEMQVAVTVMNLLLQYATELRPIIMEALEEISLPSSENAQEVMAKR